MKNVKITVIRKANYLDLQKEYENPIQHACQMIEGQAFVCQDAIKPDGFCESAWQSVFPFVQTLACGGSDFFDGWMKNPHSAMISCNDGFRPVSFYIQTIN